jgi:hypothetical protein
MAPGQQLGVAQAAEAANKRAAEENHRADPRNVPTGLTPAWFTDRELLELRKVCRDHEGELAERFLKEALRRADRSI